MQSVFDRHRMELGLYRYLLGQVDGSILFIMAVLSDVQEMTDSEIIVQELNEAKELLSAVLDFRLKS